MSGKQHSSSQVSVPAQKSSGGRSEVHKTNQKVRASPTPGKEATVTSLDYTVTLTTGEVIDVRVAKALLEEMRFLLRKQPEKIHLLQSLAFGEAQTGPSLGEMLVDDEGVLRPHARAVFLAAYRKDPSGNIHLDEPFALASETEQNTMRQANEQERVWITDLVAETLRDHKR